MGAGASMAAKCARTGAAFIFVNSFTWSIIFFTYGVAKLRRVKAAECGEASPDGGPDPERTCCGKVKAFFFEPINAALVVGAAQGGARVICFSPFSRAW